MTLQEISEFLKTVGFPIAVALVVLLRLDKSLLAVRDEMRELRGALGRRGPLPRRGAPTEGDEPL